MTAWSSCAGADNKCCLKREYKCNVVFVVTSAVYQHLLSTVAFLRREKCDLTIGLLPGEKRRMQKDLQGISSKAIACTLHIECVSSLENLTQRFDASEMTETRTSSIIKHWHSITQARGEILQIEY